MKLLWAAVCLSAFTATSAAEAQSFSTPQVINLPSENPTLTGPVFVSESFDPGTYTVQVVGKAGGGLFDGWAFATPAPGNYTDRYTYNVQPAGAATPGANINVDQNNGAQYSTATAALDAYSASSRR